MSTAERIQQAVGRTQRRVARAAFWDRFTVWIGWGFLAAGFVVLVGKWLDASVAMAGAIAAVAVPAIGAAIAVARRPRLSPEAAAILIDRTGNLEGYPLLCAAFPGTEWAEQRDDLAPRAEASVPPWKPWPLARRAIPGTLFLLVSLLLPQQEGLAGTPLRRPDAAAKREVQLLAEKIEKLEEKDVLPEDDLERMKKELEALNEAADRKSFSPEAWEGLDHMSEEMSRMVQNQAARADKASAALAAASETLQSSEVDEALLTERLQELKNAIKEMGGTPMPDTLRQALEKMEQQGGGTPTEADLQALQHGMKELQELMDQVQYQQDLVMEEGHDHSKGG